VHTLQRQLARQRDKAASPGNDTRAVIQLKQEYETKLAAAQRRAEVLQKKQAEGEQLLQVQRVNQEKVKAVEASLTQMREKQTRLSERLGEELRIKAELERELAALRKKTAKDGHELVKLEARAKQQAESLVRQGTELRALKRRVRDQQGRVGADAGDRTTGKVWLAEEVEAEVQRRVAAQQLMRDREEAERLRAEQHAVERLRDSLQVEKLRRSQAVGPELLRVSRRLGGISQAIASETAGKDGREAALSSQARQTSKARRAQLIAERATLTKELTRLQDQLEAEELLAPDQEQQLIILSEHLHVIQAALDYREDVVAQAEAAATAPEAWPARQTNHMAQRLESLSMEECRKVALDLFERMISLRLQNAESQGYIEDLEVR
jgi:hypothetical protein